MSIVVLVTGETSQTVQGNNCLYPLVSGPVEFWPSSERLSLKQDFETVFLSLVVTGH